jgi:2-iminobutanoate/2-iminopropanoate deaminase
MTDKPWRESFDIPGVGHGTTPIPMGTRVGSMLFSSGIMGMDPQTGKLAADGASQTACAFRNMDALLAAAASGLGDVARMTVFVTDISLREHVNREWLARFPDPHARPARHTIVKDLAGGMLVQLEIIAVLQPYQGE